MVGDHVASCVVPVKLVHDAETERRHFSSIFGKRCELAHSFGSDADSDSSIGDLGHNTWNPLLDMIAEYRTGLVLLRFLQDEEAGRVGITSHFALDVMSHAMGQWRRDLCCGRADVDGEFETELGGASRGTGA